MGWQKKGGQEYYYRSVRVNGVPKKIYVGAGSTGHVAEIEAIERRLKRLSDMLECVELIKRFDRMKSRNDELFRFVVIYIRSLLMVRGLYLHKGYEWRVRGKKKDEQE